MTFISRFIMTLILSFSFITTNNIVYANQGQNLIETVDIINYQDQIEQKENFRKLLKTDEAKKILLANGYSEKEMQMRLNSLTQNEFNELQHNINQAQAGGVLVTIILVLLIIYLAQRI
ncbi:MAG: PA2779 family protein [Bacteriovoracaceae bacterium]|jgi:hypothetical protein|nr:hypothetical protein [Halobacteriovoraceae bacterium]MDP7321971.1 PA2779 family protein [Bacteriovoracaceae bacterium]